MVQGWSGSQAAIASLLRDVLTPAAGIGLTVHEATRGGDPRWDLLVLYAGMMGLPSMTFLDWRHGGKLQSPPPSVIGSAPPSPTTPG